MVKVRQPSHCSARAWVVFRWNDWESCSPALCLKLVLAIAVWREKLSLPENPVKAEKPSANMCRSVWGGHPSAQDVQNLHCKCHFCAVWERVLCHHFADSSDHVVIVLERLIYHGANKSLKTETSLFYSMHECTSTFVFKVFPLDMFLWSALWRSCSLEVEKGVPQFGNCWDFHFLIQRALPWAM